jgi:signal transduction histidine kinase
MEQLTIEEVDAIEVLNFVLEQNLPNASRKDITLAVDFEETGNFQVRADHRGLNRVLSNLVSNAIKFSPQSSAVNITVELQPEAGMIRIAIQDQGPGLKAEDHAHLFTPYRRLSAKPTGGESSTGLGLSIAHGLLKKMNGAIGCESKPGAGACFWLTLPAV